MNYLYHRKKGIKGNTLYPLNELKNIFPEVYGKHIKKYVGREFVMEQKIPKLNCLWNDVLHFSAVHPLEIKKSLAEVGFKYENVSWDFYEINQSDLDQQKIIVYLYKPEFLGDKFNKENWEIYNPEDIEKYSVLPKETKEYYKESFEKGESPLFMAFSSTYFI